MFKFYKPPNGSTQNTKQTTQSQQNQGEKISICESALFGTRCVANSNICESLNSIPRFISLNQIKLAFSMLDKNNDDFVDVNELSEMLSNLGTPISSEILSQIVASASKKGS